MSAKTMRRTARYRLKQRPPRRPPNAPASAPDPRPLPGAPRAHRPATRHPEIPLRRGTIFRRCGCRDPRTGKQIGVSCPRLQADPDHGTWSFDTTLVTFTGERARLRGYGLATADEAAAKLREALESTDRKQTAMVWTLDRFFKYWLGEIEPNLSPSSFHSYARDVRKELVPVLGDVRLADLDTGTINSYFNRLSRRKTKLGTVLSPGTVQHIRATLRTALNVALRHKLIDRNPCHGVSLSGHHPDAEVWTPDLERLWRLTGQRPTVAVWTTQQLATFLDRAYHDRLFLLWLIIAVHGLRRGEAAALRLDDYLATAGKLCIDENLTIVNGREVLGRPKSQTSQRTVAMCAYLRHLSARHVRSRLDEIEAEEGTNQGWMFVHPNGAHIRADWITKRFAELLAEYDLPPIRLHDLRHGAASVMRASGLDLTYTQENHGHSSPFTTLRYTHQLPEVVHSQAEQHWDYLNAATSIHFERGAHATQS